MESTGQFNDEPRTVKDDSDCFHGWPGDQGSDALNGARRIGK
jgi:hypothetical protein